MNVTQFQRTRQLALMSLTFVALYSVLTSSAAAAQVNIVVEFVQVDQNISDLGVELGLPINRVVELELLISDPEAPFPNYTASLAVTVEVQASTPTLVTYVSFGTTDVFVNHFLTTSGAFLEVQVAATSMAQQSPVDPMLVPTVPFAYTLEGTLYDTDIALNEDAVSLADIYASTDTDGGVWKAPSGNAFPESVTTFGINTATITADVESITITVVP